MFDKFLCKLLKQESVSLLDIIYTFIPWALLAMPAGFAVTDLYTGEAMEFNITQWLLMPFIGVLVIICVYISVKGVEYAAQKMSNITVAKCPKRK